eukprot:6202921-Pleurochrysis_carterae.AAC.2
MRQGCTGADGQADRHKHASGRATSAHSHEHGIIHQCSQDVPLSQPNKPGLPFLSSPAIACMRYSARCLCAQARWIVRGSLAQAAHAGPAALAHGRIARRLAALRPGRAAVLPGEKARARDRRDTVVPY